MPACLRMYSRKVGGGSEWLERWGVRGFVTYAAIRAAGWSTGWLEADASYAAAGSTRLICSC